MNFLKRLIRRGKCKDSPAEKLKQDIVESKQEGIDNLKETNNTIRVMIESGELKFRVIKKNKKT